MNARLAERLKRLIAATEEAEHAVEASIAATTRERVGQHRERLKDRKLKRVELVVHVDDEAEVREFARRKLRARGEV